MSHLTSCPSCSSLNPSEALVCLNCDHALSAGPKRSSVASRLIKGAGLVAMSMTLTACYGGGDMGCTDYDADGVCSWEDCDDEDANVGVCSEPEGGSTGGVSPMGGSEDDPEGGAVEPAL